MESWRRYDVTGGRSERTDLKNELKLIREELVTLETYKARSMRENRNRKAGADEWLARLDGQISRLKLRQSEIASQLFRIDPTEHD